MDGIDKQYSLRWERHAFNLATEAGCFFQDESFLDCTLSAEGKCIEAHKIILSASSSYLSSLLKITPDKHPILIFNDMKFEQLKSIVSFIYNGSVNVSENNIHGFLNAAQSLLIKGLSEDDASTQQPGNKTFENVKKAHQRNVEVQGGFRKSCSANKTIRKSDSFLEQGKNAKKIKLTPKMDGSYVECEESLSKLQEISFTKYINQNLSGKQCGRNDMPDVRCNGPSDEKVKDNYVVKSWKHNSVEDLNGRHKQTKNSLFRKFKLEKPPIVNNEDCELNEKIPERLETDLPGNLCDKKTEIIEDRVKLEGESEVMVLVEPKQEIIEEDDTNSENFDDSHPSGMDSRDSDSLYDGRPTPGYFPHPIVDRGVPVPLLMCKTSLSEPDTPEPGWIPPIPNADQLVNAGNHDLSQDGCRSCLQDLPCPTCTKKYKSRYALNRHILYECGKARKSFSCDECGKKVTRQDTLQKHKLIHLVQHLKEKESEPESPEISKLKKKC